MANVTSQFLDKRKEFLDTRIVLVPEPRTPGKGPRSFWFDDMGGYVSLKAGTPASGDPDTKTMNAYWLSWATGQITVLDLDGAADFFFTSHMTNCTFKVLTSNMKAPKVAHVAGTLGLTAQKAKEKDILLGVAATDLATSKGFVLSTAGAKTHGYGGQDFKNDNKEPDPGSAFVFGVKGEDGNWSFKAQIVKANLADENAFKNSLKNAVPRIADLYEFK